MTKLENALRIIGSIEAAKEILIEALRKIEIAAKIYQGPVRDDISGPIVDALFSEDEIISKSLNCGTQFEFLYRSKIAREFVLSQPATPNHAWEPQTSKLLSYLGKQFKTALVGGAYFGDHVVLIAQAMQANGGTCHAFEPNKAQANMLRRNVELNSLDNVVVNQQGLWDISRVAMKLSGDDALAHSEELNGSDTVDSFQTITIDDYLSENGLKQLDFIMLDIEGGELKALNGAIGQLSRDSHAPIVVFELHAAYVDWSEGLTKTPIVRFLIGLGFSVFAVRDYNANQDMTGCPIELIPAAEVYLLGPPHGFNMIAVKNQNILANELFRFRHNFSPKLLRHKDPLLHQPLAD